MNKEELKKYIEENYPNITLKNQYFLDEKALKDFPIDIIIIRLSQLTVEEAFPLYMNLYQYGNSESTKDMIKYITCENPEYLTIKNEKKYSTDNIIKEYSRLYGMKEHTIEELKQIEKENLTNNSSKYYNFINFDINYYNELIIIQKLYKNGKIKYSDITPFIEFTFEMLKDNLIKTEGNYKPEYNNYLNEIISHLLIRTISPDQLYNCMNDYNKIKNLVVVSKLGSIVPKLNNIPLEVLTTMKGKQIKSIYEESTLKVQDLDKVKKNYNEQDIITIITNMSVLLGSDNVSNIIKHLPKDDLKVNRLFSAFLNIDLTNVKTKDNKVIYNNEFIKLFIGDNLEEPNNLLNLIYEGKTHLSDKIETIYAYWDILDTRFKAQPLKTRLAFLEEALNENMIILNPDEYLLEGDILNSYYDNKQFQHKKNINLIEEIREEYAKMKHNYQKTIPYVNGEHEGYYYETIKANDPSLFVMGSSSDCCFKIGGDADSFVKYCAENPNGRVLAVKNPKGKIVAMAPMVRNGNLILCNSIESTMTSNNEFMAKMFEILEEAGNKMIEISSKVETEEDCLKVLLVGSYKNEISKFHKYKAVKYGEIDDKCINPLDTSLYVNMGGFDWDNYIISSALNLNYDNLRSFEPKTLYNDPRKEVVELEKEFINEQVKKIVTSIYFESNRQAPNFDNIEKVIFNEDWLIIIDKKYKITSCIIGKDPRATIEYEEYLDLAKEHCSYYDEKGNLIETEKYSYK